MLQVRPLPRFLGQYQERIWCNCHRISQRSLSRIVGIVGEASSQMQSESYMASSHNQYSAHGASLDMLTESLKRVLVANQRNGGAAMRWVDFGSADGSNSIHTLHHCMNVVRNHCETQPIIHTTFSEHPASDEEVLLRVLQHNQEFFETNNLTYSTMMRSFYESMFSPQSIDFATCHICLHWLNREDASMVPVHQWKALVQDKNWSDDHLETFTQINERTCPPTLKDAWLNKLATPHLSLFFQLRAHELKVGGECFAVMVANPHQFMTPPFSPSMSSEASILTQVLQRCVERGTIRRQVLRDTIVPYYAREVDDVREAVKHANQQLQRDKGLESSSNTTSPKPRLELVQVRKDMTVTGGGGADMTGTAELFWSIHAGSVLAAGLLPEEEVHAKEECFRLFEELFDPTKGVQGHFIACTVRRVE